MMDAVKRGADRQELHERIRVHSMAASRVCEEEAAKTICWSVSRRIRFSASTMEELEEIMLPEKYVGRAPQQTEDFLNHEVANALQKYEDLKSSRRKSTFKYEKPGGSKNFYKNHLPSGSVLWMIITVCCSNFKLEDSDLW